MAARTLVGTPDPDPEPRPDPTPAFMPFATYQTAAGHVAIATVTYVYEGWFGSTPVQSWRWEE